MKRISFKGVVVGGIADIISTNILAIPFVIFVIATRGLLHMPKDQVGAAFTHVVHASTLLYGVQQLIGFCCSMFGGYIAARIADHD
jgi:hypothetical protein